MIQRGTIIEDRYEILERIGSGGMSEVYKAKCHKLNRYVAIKFLKPEYCEDKNFVTNFQIEAQSAAALLHPNVVSVYDVNEVDGIYYIVMEYVDGITLKKYISINGKLPAKEATSIAIQVAQGMEAAHNANIVHRDIKPQNVLISREGKIKVTDFGIARTTTANTLSADILGSAQYISPEQARGDQVDARSDVYSFGIIFYEMITGKLPFDGDSPVTVALKHIQEKVPLVSDVVEGIPEGVTRIIEKCTQKKPERRYQKTSSLLADLKTSLVTPNENFVILDPEEDSSATVIMSGPEARILKDDTSKARSRVYEPDEEYDEYDEYDDEYVDEYEDEVPEKNKSGRKADKLLTIFGIIAGVIIIAVLAIVIVTTVKGGGCNGNKKQNIATTTVATVEVPNIKGLSLAKAKAALRKENLDFAVEYDVSAKEDQDKVIRQSIEEGAKVEEGTIITIVLGSGPDAVPIGDYRNKTQEEAVKELTDLGLEVSIKTDFSNTIETGRVIETNPIQNSKVAKGSVIEITVSRGPKEKEATVPKVVGQSEEEAIKILKEAGLECRVNYQHFGYSIGYVISQSITSGENVDRGTTITILVGADGYPTTQPIPTSSSESTETTETTESSETTESVDPPTDDPGDEPAPPVDPPTDPVDPGEGSGGDDSTD